MVRKYKRKTSKRYKRKSSKRYKRKTNRRNRIYKNRTCNKKSRKKSLRCRKNKKMKGGGIYETQFNEWWKLFPNPFDHAEPKSCNDLIFIINEYNEKFNWQTCDRSKTNPLKSGEFTNQLKQGVTDTPEVIGTVLNYLQENKASPPPLVRDTSATGPLPSESGLQLPPPTVTELEPEPQLEPEPEPQLELEPEPQLEPELALDQIIQDINSGIEQSYEDLIAQLEDNDVKGFSKGAEELITIIKETGLERDHGVKIERLEDILGQLRESEQAEEVSDTVASRWEKSSESNVQSLDDVVGLNMTEKGVDLSKGKIESIQREITVNQDKIRELSERLQRKTSEATDLKQRIDRKSLTGQSSELSRVKYISNAEIISNGDNVMFRDDGDNVGDWKSGKVNSIMLVHTQGIPRLVVKPILSSSSRCVEITASYTTNPVTLEELYYWDARAIHKEDGNRTISDIELESQLRLEISEVQTEAAELAEENNRLGAQIDKIASHHEKRGVSTEWHDDGGDCIWCAHPLSEQYPPGEENVVIDCDDDHKITIHRECYNTVSKKYDPKSFLCP